MLRYSDTLAVRQSGVTCPATVVSNFLVAMLQVNDISLEDYIAVKSKNAVFVPHTAGRYQKKRFRKAQCPIVERCVQVLVVDWVVLRGRYSS